MSIEFYNLTSLLKTLCRWVKTVDLFPLSFSVAEKLLKECLARRILQEVPKKEGPRVLPVISVCFRHT